MSNLKKIIFYTDVFGNICIKCKNKKIYEVCIGTPEKEMKNLGNYPDECLNYKKLFLEYLKGKPLNIDIDKIYIERVSSFYQAVYRETLKIPFGCVTTYKNIAETIGKPRAYRAVATALRKNPFPVFVPCHRVIRSDGNIGGSDKESFSFRKRLLELERRENG